MMRTLTIPAVLLLSMAACSEADDPAVVGAEGDALPAGAGARAAARPDGRPVFHRGVGAPIDRDTAQRWMANLSKSGAPREEYRIEASVLFELLDDRAVGIALVYAVDAEGRPHV